MKEKKPVLGGRVNESTKQQIKELGVSVQELADFYLGHYNNKEIQDRLELKQLLQKYSKIQNEQIRIKERIEILKNNLGLSGSFEELELYLTEKDLIKSLDYLLNLYEKDNTSGKYPFAQFKISRSKNIEAEADKLHMDLEEFNIKLDNYYYSSSKQITLFE